MAARARGVGPGVTRLTAADRRAQLVRAYEAAQAADDVEAMAATALALAGLQVFGTVPGRLPAFLHQAYERSTGRRRVELAVALARTWSYGGSPRRAEPFVEEAMLAAQSMKDPALLATVLDAQLLTKWGPDDFSDRLAITTRLDDVVAHLTDVEARMNAHLWRLTTALEALDIAAIRRQLRSLDALAEETGSPRVEFFAASRRGMYALLVGDLDLATRAHAEAVAAGGAAGEPDTHAIDRALTAAIVRQQGAAEAAAREAPLFEDFGLREGVSAVAAEGALMWLYAGDKARASDLLHQLASDGFGSLPRGVDWLPTMVMLTEVAAAVGERDLARAALEVLRPYAGRGVVDGGAVTFIGVVDDVLAQASTAIGAGDEAREHRAAAAALYRQVGAGWWLRRCDFVASDVPSAVERRIVLRPLSLGSWEFGRDGATTVVHELRGFSYLRLLLQRPHVDISARTLSDAVAGHSGASVEQSDLGPVLDRAALAAYRSRLQSLDHELDDVTATADHGHASRLIAERDALLHEIRAATGLGGRGRSSGSSDERARVAVRKAVATAIDRLRTQDPSVARLLEQTVSTGVTCRYEPDPDRPTVWLLD